MIATHAWLETVPDNLTIYVLLGSISAAKPVTAYFKKTNQVNLTALWQETPYANWFETMPYIASVPRDSKFFEWVDQTKSNDWGWLAASPYEPEQIRQYFKSLTKVLMPDGVDVFFRYWDGKYLLPILDYLNQKQQASQVIPVFSHYLINQQALEVTIPSTLSEPKAYPWWKVEQELVDLLIKSNTANVAEQLVSQFQQNDPELYQKYPTKNLLIKAKAFIESDNFNIDTAYAGYKKFILGEF